MTQKTNQFNLTTRRYSEGEVRAFVESIDADVLYLHLQDRFGDYGIVGACILKYVNDEALIDTLLLSCRAFGRRVEDVYLSYCLDLAQKKSKMRAVGEYLPTAKNAMVSDFYERMGFDFLDDQGVGKTFQLDLRSGKFVLSDIYKEIIDLT